MKTLGTVVTTTMSGRPGRRNLRVLVGMLTLLAAFAGRSLAGSCAKRPAAA